MDTPATVRTEQQGPVLTITLDRPERRNAVDGPTALALRAAFEAFEADDDARVAVLTGAGGHFCAGADLQALGDPARRNPIEPTGTAPGPMGPTRMAFAKPVIAAIEGYAVAGGLELALMCDLRIAARGATFGVFCRRWGVPLIDGGTVRLPRIVGMGRALDMILSGRAGRRRRGAGSWAWPRRWSTMARRWPRRRRWRGRSPPSRSAACAPTGPRPTRSGTCRWPRR